MHPRFSDPETRERFDERAAIAEYDGGLSRNEAEYLAYAQTPDFSDDWLRHIEPAPTWDVRKPVLKEGRAAAAPITRTAA